MRKIPKKYVVNSVVLGLGVGTETFGFLNFKYSWGHLVFFLGSAVLWVAIVRQVFGLREARGKLAKVKKDIEDLSQKRGVYPATFPKKLTGPVVGYKFFSIYCVDGLRSLYQTGFRWKAGPNQAGFADNLYNHYPWEVMRPSKDNPVGFYCLEDPTDHLFNGVLGLVLCWGKTVVHERGWRSEFAMPLALIDTGAIIPKFIHFALGGPARFALSEIDLREVAKLYGIPLVDLEGAKKIIQEWNEGGDK